MGERRQPPAPPIRSVCAQQQSCGPASISRKTNTQLESVLGMCVSLDRAWRVDRPA
jgi:hypothetical protein